MVFMPLDDQSITVHCLLRFVSANFIIVMIIIETVKKT